MRCDQLTFDDSMPVYVPMTQGFVTLIDYQDFEIATRYSLYPTALGHHRTRYATAYLKSERVGFLHEIILGKAPAGMQIDHENRDGLDNRRVNLRVVSNSVNKRNAPKYRKTPQGGVPSSRYKGVTLSQPSRPRPWGARIRINSRLYKLGLFATEEQAATAYEAVCIMLTTEEGARLSESIFVTELAERIQEIKREMRHQWPVVTTEDYTIYPLRTCRQRLNRPCRLCGACFVPGEQYYDVGYSRAHRDCADNLKANCPA